MKEPEMKAIRACVHRSRANFGAADCTIRRPSSLLDKRDVELTGYG
jgi:hypothetical protein